MSTKFLKCDVDLTDFLIAFLAKKKTKDGEPYKFTPPNPLHPWYHDFRKMRTALKVEPQYIGAMIRWCFERNDFWGSVVRSPANLRKNFHKIQAQMEAPKAMTTFQKKRAAIDDYVIESSDVSCGTLTLKAFSFGLKVLLSCGGPNVDSETLTVWYEMLKDLNPDFYGKAIQHICVTEESIQTLNLVQKIRLVHNSLRFESKRLRLAQSGSQQPWIQEYKEHPERFGMPDEIRKQIRLLTKAIGH